MLITVRCLVSGVGTATSESDRSTEPLTTTTYSIYIWASAVGVLLAL